MGRGGGPLDGLAPLPRHGAEGGAAEAREQVAVQEGGQRGARLARPAGALVRAGLAGEDVVEDARCVAVFFFVWSTTKRGERDEE